MSVASAVSGRNAVAGASVVPIAPAATHILRSRGGAFVVDSLALLALLFFLPAPVHLPGHLFLWSPLAEAIYFLYFTVQELTFGRTLGKWFYGIRVVDLNGNRPGIRAIVVRNVVRLAEVSPIVSWSLGNHGSFTISLLWIAIIVVLLSPCRQRLGDRWARTLVVGNQPTKHCSANELRIASPDRAIVGS